MAVLGISGGYHDSAAAVVADGVLVAAAQEERFSRIKHDASMPARALRWCLDRAQVGVDDLEAVVYYEKPLTTYERVLSTHASVGPRGFPQFARAVGTWTRRKLWVGASIERLVAASGRRMPQLLYCEHHLSHAAAAFHPSPFESAAIMTVDGVGEWATTSIGRGGPEGVQLDWQLDFPDSIGLLYSAFTAYCGFAVNDGEYKLMGLAPYGEPTHADALLGEVVQLAEDGSVRLDQRYFDYRVGRRMASDRLHRLLGAPARAPGEPLTQHHADVARSVQLVLEEIVLTIGRHLHRLTGERAVCLAGGVALNCVANSRLLREGPFEDMWIQPAAGDAGSAVGAALWGWHEALGAPRVPQRPDGMSTSALGPSYGDDEIARWLCDAGVEHRALGSDDEVDELVAEIIDRGGVVGWFQGPMEFGPRALGHRSILADPRDVTAISRINRAVKGREGFRPFAPAVMAERASEWFDLDVAAPYMLLTAPVRSARVEPSRGRSFTERLESVNSDIPACTHVDGSARVQTVHRERSPRFHGLLQAFERRTGCPVLLNTSFNRADEPIVRTPAEAYRCFRAAGLDLLVLGRCIVRASSTGTDAELVGAELR